MVERECYSGRLTPPQPPPQPPHRRRTAGKKTLVFGLCKRHGRVYTEVVPDCAKPTILAAIRRKVDLRSVIHSDGFASYDGLVDMGYQKHLRVDHARSEFSSRTVRGNHINGPIA